MRTELGLRLKETRVSKGLSLRAASKLTKVDPLTISELEKGARRPYPGTLRKLSDGYGIPLRELLELEEPVLAGKGETPDTGHDTERDEAEESLTLPLLENDLIADWVHEHEGKLVVMSDEEFEEYLRQGVHLDIDAEGVPQGLVLLEDRLKWEEGFVDGELRRELSLGGGLYQKADFSTPEAERRTIRDAQESARLGWELSQRYNLRRRQLANYSHQLYSAGKTRHYLGEVSPGGER